MVSSLEEEVESLSRRLERPSAARRAAIIQTSWWSERMVEWAMSHPSFKTELFRFVDVFPAMHGSDDVMQHLLDYFGGPDLPRALDLALGAAGHLPLGPVVATALARRNVSRVATQFIIGADPPQAVRSLEGLWRQGSAFTVDVLGERTVAEDEADRYAGQVDELLTALSERCPRWPANERLERDDLGAVPRINVSVKPSALASLYQPLTREEGLAQARSRLLPLLRRAAALGAFVNVDMEHRDVSDLSLELFHSVLGEPELGELHAGITVQAYLRDSHDELAHLIGAVAGRTPPVTVRLVKGAYWDTEVVQARARGWAVPVYERKPETDANYERCVRLLHDRHGEVRAAFGSHNPRSLAYAVAYARSVGVPDCGYEIQTLHGMGRALEEAARELGLRTRIYAPVGTLLPGMSYLVRRLLENTSNESIVRRRFGTGTGTETKTEGVARAGSGPRTTGQSVARGGSGPAATGQSVARDGTGPGATTDDIVRHSSRPGTVGGVPGSPPAPVDGYHHQPVAEWRRADVRQTFAAALDAVELGVDVPAVIDGRRVSTSRSFESVDPGDTSTLVATAAACGQAEVEDAVAVAARSLPGWSRATAAARAAVLSGAAAWLRARRWQVAALEVFEAGKPWAEADADVCEAIDFLEYYGRQAVVLDARSAVESPPGEHNIVRCQPRGICAVISPWNFPLAIPAGMVAAALVTGNTVVLKPAEQAPAVAAVLVDALRAGGLPEGALSFLPGSGEDAGALLVAHPEVAVIAFTGSKAVGLGILQTAAVTRPGQRHVKRVIAEMGGKNAIVVDSDADLDQAVPIITASAFGYAGQKCSACSRLIALDPVRDQLIARLVGATRELRIGHPREMGVQVGPLIDADARDRVRSYIELGARDGTVLLSNDEVPTGGHYVAPAIVEVDAASPLAIDEVFGPVLAIQRAADLDEAIALANRTDYALTAGIVSRSPAHIQRAAAELRAGNVYVNRPITGAVVGRQPFGGHGLSGTGAKAGGPDYLRHFVDARTISENTVRQGFAAEGTEGA